MALIVEDGTGRTDADSYASIETANAYHAAFGNVAWASASPTDKEAALRRATQYLDSHYNWRGDSLTFDQALAWPRADVWLDYGVAASWPVRVVVQACCELALRALSSSLTVDQNDRTVLETSIAGAISVKYSDSKFSGQKRFALIDDMLSNLTSGSSSGTLRIERV